MRNTLKVVLAAVALLLLFPPAYQARESGKADVLFKVSVRVSGDPEIANRVKGFIGRALRTIKDVRVTNAGPDWVLDVITVEVKLKEGVTTGYGISAVVLESFKREVLTPLLDKGRVELGHSLTADLYRVRKHMINIGSRKDIRNICVKMATDLDSEFLEVKRKK